jgi:hypothetical protein
MHPARTSALAASAANADETRAFSDSGVTLGYFFAAVPRLAAMQPHSDRNFYGANGVGINQSESAPALASYVGPRRNADRIFSWGAS